MVCRRERAIRIAQVDSRRIPLPMRPIDPVRTFVRFRSGGKCHCDSFDAEIMPVSLRDRHQLFSQFVKMSRKVLKVNKNAKWSR